MPIIYVDGKKKFIKDYKGNDNFLSGRKLYKLTNKQNDELKLHADYLNWKYCMHKQNIKGTNSD